MYAILFILAQFQLMYSFILNTIKRLMKLLQYYIIMSTPIIWHLSETSLQSDPASQLRNIKRSSPYRSNNDQSGIEPLIFNIVKLKLGEKHLRLIQEGKNIDNATIAINSLPLITDINESLKLLNLKLSIKPTNIRTWSYEFRFYDTKNERGSRRY